MSNLIWNNLASISQESNKTWQIDWDDTENYTFKDFANKINEINDWINETFLHSDVDVELFFFRDVYIRDPSHKIQSNLKMGPYATITFVNEEDSLAFKLKYDV